MQIEKQNRKSRNQKSRTHDPYPTPLIARAIFSEILPIYPPIYARALPADFVPLPAPVNQKCKQMNKTLQFCAIVPNPLRHCVKVL